MMRSDDLKDYRVVVTDDRYGSYKEEEEVFKDLNIHLDIRNFQSPQEALEGLKDADGILCNLFPMTGDIIAALDKCRVISRYGVGYDNVAVEAATEKGIWVARVPDYASEDTSDQALALFLGCVRKISFKDREIRRGRWNLHKEQPNHRITGKTFGIVGYGGVGQALHRKIQGLSLSEILVCDPTEDPDFIQDQGAVKVDLETLLSRSDYVSLHVPLRPDTRHLIGKEQFKLMKNRAILINTARGGVVDEAALAEALRSGEIAGAGLDVFEHEPVNPDNPLLLLDRVILSDHAGWYSEESLKELKTKAALNIAEVLQGRSPLYSVNQPPLAISRTAGKEKTSEIDKK
jgi:D-3-phosphoglycerate dehydrogenase